MAISAPGGMGPGSLSLRSLARDDSGGSAREGRASSAPVFMRARGFARLPISFSSPDARGMARRKAQCPDFAGRPGDHPGSDASYGCARVSRRAMRGIDPLSRLRRPDDTGPHPAALVPAGRAGAGLRRPPASTASRSRLAASRGERPSLGTRRRGYRSSQWNKSRTHLTPGDEPFPRAKTSEIAYEQGQKDRARVTWLRVYLGCVGLGCVGLGCVGLGCVGLGCANLVA